MKGERKMPRRQAKTSKTRRIQPQKITPTHLTAQTHRLFQQPALMFAVKGFEQSIGILVQPRRCAAGRRPRQGAELKDDG